MESCFPVIEVFPLGKHAPFVLVDVLRPSFREQNVGSRISDGSAHVNVNWLKLFQGSPHASRELADQRQAANQPQGDLQFQCPQVESWEASITDGEATCLIIFSPSAVSLSCIPWPWRTGEERLNHLFVANHNGPVFSILLAREVVSFPWLIDLILHVYVAEGGTNRVQSTSEVSHRGRSETGRRV